MNKFGIVVIVKLIFCREVLLAVLLYVKKIVMKLFFTFCILLLVVSCIPSERGNIKLIKKFPKEKYLSGELIKLEKNPLLVNDFIVVDSLIIAESAYIENDTIFSVYNKNTFRYLNSFGQKGRGPKEFLEENPIITGQYKMRNNDICIWLGDLFSYKLVNITKSIKENKTVIERVISLPKSVGTGGDNVFVFENDDLLGTPFDSQRGRIFYYSAQTGEVKWVEYFPKVNNPPIIEKNMHNLYGGPAKLSEDKKLFVSALSLFKRIDVFDNNTNHKFSIKFNDSPKDVDLISKSLVRYYYDVDISKRFIYALNNNLTSEQVINGGKGAFSELQVFSIDGDPICVYKLDHLLSRIEVDEENDYILGFAYLSDLDESRLIRYKL